MKTLHFVTVWNPSYARSAMESHLEVLLEHARRARSGRPDAAHDDEDVYVWWGKVRSPNRQQPLPHLGDILATVTHENPDDEQHLYLTDYRSLYVAHVTNITTDDPRTDDAEHVPAYYRSEGLECDCWFQLDDIRRVVVDDTVAVVEQLQELRNVRYHDRPVSLYGGMVELPLIVKCDVERWYFAREIRDVVTNGARWVEFDAERTGTGAMERELRLNMFGESVWRRLDPAVHTFCATAEEIFRRNRDDAAFDFSPVVMDLAKAVEVQAHHVLRRLLRSAPPALRHVTVEGRRLDVMRDHLTLRQLARALSDREMHQFITTRGSAAGWLTSSFPSIADKLAEGRNLAAHEARVGLEQATVIRDRILGVGCEGDLVKLAGCGPV